MKIWRTFFYLGGTSDSISIIDQRIRAGDELVVEKVLNHWRIQGHPSGPMTGKKRNSYALKRRSVDRARGPSKETEFCFG
jgi:hypothetical protein